MAKRVLIVCRYIGARRLLAFAFASAIALPLPQAWADEVAQVHLVKDGARIDIETFGPATAQTPFTLASVGKTMTAVAVLRMAEEELLLLDVPVSELVSPDIAEGLDGLDAVTIRHLLTMTSGLPDYLDDAYIDDALNAPDRVQRQHVAITYAYDQRRLFPPGSDFDYSNTNYVLLGIIMENVTGKSYAQLMSDFVFEPAGMSNSFVFGSRPLPDNFPNGHESGAHFRDYYSYDGFGDGGVIATAGDVARFYEALFVERSLLGQSSLEMMLKDPVGEGYGMGIELEDGFLGHSGGDLGFSSDVRFDPESERIAVILAAEADADTSWTYDVLDD